MLEFIHRFNAVIAIVFTICYSYQFFYEFVALVFKPKRFIAKNNHRYAVLIPARNENNVISQLIDSVKRQNYPAELVDIFVIADNCTDNTAEVARQAGAIVYERHDKKLVGKGYALNYLLGLIKTEYADKHYNGFFVFDADNLLDESYITEMNKVFDNGYRVVTSYRNSKNYGSNWISAGYSQWFLREARALNNARMILGTSCAISGTGFLLSSEIVEKNHGWKHYLLTEDIEFTIDSVINGETIGYCGAARFYDEQPTDFKQSWNQRLRWVKGGYQVFIKYGFSLIKGLFKRKGFACFDMLMTVSPALIVTVIGVLVNVGCFVGQLCVPFPSVAIIRATLWAIGSALINYYLLMLVLGAITVVCDWKQIHSTPWRKALYAFTFPIYAISYIPIAIVAMFKKIEWTPIRHSVTKSLKDIKEIHN